MEAPPAEEKAAVAVGFIGYGSAAEERFDAALPEAAPVEAEAHPDL